jgi:hypothetical protein
MNRIEEEGKVSNERIKLKDDGRKEKKKQFRNGDRIGPVANR